MGTPEGENARPAASGGSGVWLAAEIVAVRGVARVLVDAPALARGLLVVGLVGDDFQEAFETLETGRALVIQVEQPGLRLPAWTSFSDALSGSEAVSTTGVSAASGSLAST